MYIIQLNLVIRTAPMKMNIKRITIAPKTPQNKTL